MKKVITLLVALVSAVLASVALAAPPLAQDQESRAAAIANLMQSWQARILAFNLPVDDAKNWSSRNMAKFGKLNADRLALAQRASTLGELEMVLLEAPIAEGSRLDVLMANKRGDISMMSSGAAKLSPGSSPASYAGLVFSALSPCRILDSRPSQGGTGSWLALSTNLIKIGPYSTAGGGYATGPGAQGGSATSCGLDALAGPGQVAMIMAAVSTVSQAGAGYLTFFSLGAPNPGTTSVSQWFQPGYVQTSFVLIPSDLVGTVAASGFTSAGTEVIIDVVGYFAAETNDGVTSITAGTGLTGGTITTTGTVAIATGYQLPQACTNGQVAQSNGAGSWSCVTPVSGGGTVTGVSASAPLASSGGTAPNISLTGSIPVASGGTGQTTLASNGIVYGQGTAAVGTAVGATGQVLTGTVGAPAWSDSLSLNGNLTLVNPSTATTGNIMKGANRFMHNIGFANTFIGELAGNFTMTGGGNNASGFQALMSNTTGNDNTADGMSALQNNTTGTGNTAIGTGVLFSNTTGNNNTASGNGALSYNTTGGYNTAFGGSALIYNTTGYQNTASGAAALASNTTGFNNAASGDGALYFNTTGSNNTASGHQALVSNTTGLNNTAFGYLALGNSSTGNSNIALGSGAGGNLTTGSNNIDIAHAGVAAESNTIRIGIPGTHTDTYLAGNVGIDTAGVMNFGLLARQMLNLYSTIYGIGVQTATLYSRSTVGFSWFQGGVHNNAQNNPGGGVELMRLDSTGLTVKGTLVFSSDRNSKENFAAVDSRSVLEKVASLPMQSWNYLADNNKVRHLGPMAQDFHAAFAIGQDDTHMATVDEGGVALAAIQGLNAKLEERDAANRRLMQEKDDRIAAQAARIAALEQQTAWMVKVLGRMERQGLIDTAELRVP